MRLRVSKSKNSSSLYVIKTVYEGKKERTITVEKLGTEIELRKKLNGEDPYVWAKQYIAELNKKEKEGKTKIIKELDKNALIISGEKNICNIGYMFLEKICSRLEDTLDWQKSLG